MGNLEDIAEANRQRKSMPAPLIPVTEQSSLTVRNWTIHDRGRQFGPHTEIEIAMLLASGSISNSALAWREGAPRWIPVTSIVPLPAQPQGATTFSNSQPYSGNTITFTISAISNIFCALGSICFIWMCFPIFLTALFIILAIYEFKIVSDAKNISVSEFSDRARNIATFEIISILLGNPISMVCGIITLVNLPKTK